MSEQIDAFTKLKFESEFQELSPGGAISYVEVPNMQDNLEAVMSVLQFIYDNIMYAELNTKSDYCQCCGYDGEIRIVEDDGKLVWECPKCGNRDQSKLNVARRTCGYIGTQFWNQGRTQEIGTGCCTCKSLSLPCICPDRTQQAVRSGLFCRQTNCPAGRGPAGQLVAGGQPVDVRFVSAGAQAMQARTQARRARAFSETTSTGRL